MGATALLGTGSDFLLQYNADEENVENQNGLGLQLMLIRDELRLQESPTYAGGPSPEWTHFISRYINIRTGIPIGKRQDNFWQATVQSARDTLQREILSKNEPPNGGN